jgi:hypothetical protein
MGSGRKRLCIFIISFSGMVGWFGLLQKHAVALAAPDSSELVDATNKTFTVPIKGYFETCMDNAAIYRQKRSDNEWERVSSDLPPRGLYYLDEKFVGYGMCDVVVCTELPTPYTVNLVEYEKIGEKNPPADSGSTANVLPVYKTIPLTGTIKVTVDYFSDKDCRHRETVSTVIQK